MSLTTRIIRSGAAVAMALFMWGCAGGGGGAQLTPSGHPAGYVNAHWSDYAKKPDSCTQCHGSVTDINQAGGISGVSCFSCHYPNGPAHPSNWSQVLQHGRQGAQAAAGDWTGMASCEKCHGSGFSGGLTGVSCTSCHTKAPHPDAPWRSATPSSNSSHTATDPSNAAVCFRCHAAAVQPPAQLPGCYNNTMCHGTP